MDRNLDEHYFCDSILLIPVSLCIYYMMDDFYFKCNNLSFLDLPYINHKMNDF